MFDLTAYLVPSEADKALTDSEKLDALLAVGRKVEAFIDYAGPQVAPLVKNLEPIIGKLGGPMGAMLGSFLR